MLDYYTRVGGVKIEILIKGRKWNNFFGSTKVDVYVVEGNTTMW